LGQRRLFLVTEGSEVGLKVSCERMQGSTGASDEAIESGPLEESADQADAASALLLKSDQGSQEDATEEGFAGLGAKEGNEVVVEVGGVVTAKPVAEGGARDAMLLGIPSLGSMIGMAEVVMSIDAVGPRPTERLCARAGRFARV